MRLQGIMVVAFIILDWMFAFMNTTTMIPFAVIFLGEVQLSCLEDPAPI